METLIQATALTRSYGHRKAVDELSLELQRGDILGFLGPNGAGKSTTMRMLTGNLAPHQGEILVNGIPLLQHPIEAKQHLGYLPESPPLYRELTVDEYLLFVARLHRVPKAFLYSALQEAKDRCGLNEDGHRLIANLSKGYQQRVGIAQAIIHNPTVIVLDEPTVGLDPIQIREIRQLIRHLGESHAVILSTHILPEVQSICNRVVIINEGRTVYSAQLAQEAEPIDSLRIGFDQPPNETALAALPGVEKVEPLTPHDYLLQLRGTSSVSELCQRLVDLGCGLRELTPIRRNLEQIFVELTTQECAA